MVTVHQTKKNKNLYESRNKREDFQAYSRNKPKHGTRTINFGDQLEQVDYSLIRNLRAVIFSI